MTHPVNLDLSIETQLISAVLHYWKSEDNSNCISGIMEF